MRFCLARQCFCDVEFAGCVSVLAVADERAVHPDVEGRREAVEAHSHAAARIQGLCHGLVQVEGTAVDGDAAVTGGSRGLRVLMSVPRHLDIDIGRWPQPLGFERGGDGEGMDIALIECVGRGFKGYTGARGECDFPGAVEALAGCRGTMCGAGAQSIDSEGTWIVEPGQVGRVDKSGAGHDDLRTCDVALERTCSAIRVNLFTQARNNITMMVLIINTTLALLG